MRPRSITESQAHLIARLLAERPELTQRQIAALAGTSHGTVSRIRRGEWKDSPPVERDEEAEIVRSVIPARCPTCGGYVYMPCRLCAVRRAKQEAT